MMIPLSDPGHSWRRYYCGKTYSNYMDARLPRASGFVFIRPIFRYGIAICLVPH